MIRNLLRNISNIPGWTTKKKLVVIESDDWGSIRMPSKIVYDKLLSHGVRVDLNHFTKYDSLELNSDLELLFTTLQRYKDVYGNHPVITALCNVANPDFKLIEDDGYRKYHYQPLTSTILEYPNSESVIELWKKGAEDNIFKPQFHGREHLNIARWMGGLQNELPITKMSFDLKLTGIQPQLTNEDRGEYQAAFDIDNIDEVKEQNLILENGIELFEEIVGYKPKYFCPPNGCLSLRTEQVLVDNGIQFINLPKFFKEPLGNNKFRNRLCVIGSKSKLGLHYINRNVFFEPTLKKNAVDSALNEMAVAFRWRKPAVISSHRVNYVSRIDENNRTNGLNELGNLIKKIIKNWPDVEFISTTDLGALVIAN
jgi:hypothetical protein